MLNRVVPAAAEGLPKPTRRQALRTLAAGGAAGALTAGAILAATPAEAVAVDPCLAFVEGWERATNACDAGPEGGSEAFWQTHCVPFEDTATWGVIPAATTPQGAATALRKALEFGDMEQQDANLVRAALSYLEGASA